MTFNGIPPSALDFYEDLEADNSKAFWTEHKQIYEESVRAPIQELSSALEASFGTPKLFRPYRDVRFSRDKTPYKTHQGVWFEDVSCYFEVSAAGLRVAAGYWRTSPDQVARLRRAVDNEIAGEALRVAVQRVRRDGFDVHGDQLVRVPTGFAKDHPRGDLLRYRTLVVSKSFGFPRWLHEATAKNEVAKAWRHMSPLVDWLDTHVGKD